MKVKKYQLIEVIKSAAQASTGVRIFLGDQPQLRADTTKRVRIKAIEAYDDVVMPISPQGITVATPAQVKNVVLVLSVGGKEVVNQIPLQRLNPFQGTGVSAAVPTSAFLLDEVDNVDWAKSYLFPCADPGNAVVCFPLGIFYELSPGDF